MLLILLLWTLIDQPHLRLLKQIILNHRDSAVASTTIRPQSHEIPSSMDFVLLSLVFRGLSIPSIPTLRWYTTGNSPRVIPTSSGRPLISHLPSFRSNFSLAITSFTISWNILKLIFSWPGACTILLITSMCLCYATLFATVVLPTFNIYVDVNPRWKSPIAFPAHWMILSCFMFNHEFVTLFEYGIFGDLLAHRPSPHSPSLESGRYGKGPKPGGFIINRRPGLSHRRSQRGSPKRNILRQRSVPWYRKQREFRVIFKPRSPTLFCVLLPYLLPTLNFISDYGRRFIISFVPFLCNLLHPKCQSLINLPSDALEVEVIKYCRRHVLV
jgi:hypothetical protein